jgi:type IV pilus assembly protein PilF
LLLGGCASWASPKQRESARISYDLGVESLNRQDYREALRALLAAIESDPNLPQAHNALALVLHVMHHDDQALVHYRRALELKPNFSEATNNMGILLLDTGHYSAAIAAFESALRNLLYPTPYLAEGNMGWAYYKLGDLAHAREHMEAAVHLEPRFCRGYEWLARMIWEQHGAAGGAADAVAADGDSALDPRAAAELVAHSQRFMRHCVDDAAIARTIAPEYRREMYYYLGLGLLGQGKPKLALEKFAECTRGMDMDRLQAPQDGDAPIYEYARRCQTSATRAQRALSP